MAAPKPSNQVTRSCGLQKIGPPEVTRASGERLAPQNGVEHTAFGTHGAFWVLLSQMYNVTGQHPWLGAIFRLGDR